MKIIKALSTVFAVLFALSACGKAPTESPESATDTPEAVEAVDIVLSDNGITVDGKAAGSDNSAAVYTTNDIIYYESGKDFTYGEGFEMPEGERPEKPFGERPDMQGGNGFPEQELSTEFVIADGANMFGGVSFIG